ncbi:hypothetical protein A9Q96_09355 [Rhodobacterales bacterium 52_120_T64]|nr:hypothetical protein A9Q96_09355 [Rhodobacterales bacterium 52_120_T64]
MSTKELRLIPAESAAQELLGYEVGEAMDGTGFCRFEIQPKHINSVGAVHGGFVGVLLDTASGATARLHLDRETFPPVITVSLTINYIAPAKSGRVIARGKVTGGGRKLLFVTSSLEDENGQMLATSNGVFRRVARKTEG